jgi:hypothetical protein
LYAAHTAAEMVWLSDRQLINHAFSKQKKKILFCDVLNCKTFLAERRLYFKKICNFMKNTEKYINF